VTAVLQEQAAIWAIVLVIFLPITIIGMGEIEERLRQRDSAFARVASILRVWTIPLFAILALLRGMFDLDASRLIVRIVGTAFIISIGAAGIVLLRIIVARFERRAHVDTDERGLPRILLALPRLLLIIAVGWILLEGVWGVDLSSAFAALGVTSLIISLALQDTLSGLASGLLLLSDAPFQPGDWIKAVDIEGRVEDINWRSSRIRDRNGDLFVVPNAMLAGATIVNYYQPDKLHRIVVTVQVAYSNPPTLAKEMLLDAARSTPGVLEDPPPDVKVVTVDDPLMTYDIQMWIGDHKDSPRIKSDFGALVWYASHRHDVPLPSPAFDLYMYDGVRTGEESKPSRAEVRRRLQVSPLIAQLDDADIDRIVSDAQPMRFARDEVIIDGGTSSRDLYVLASGAARIVVAAPDGVVLNIAEISAGEVFGVIGTAPTRTQRPRIVAVTDCEVVIVNEAVAAEVASRTPELSTVFNRMVTAWERRLDRMLESYMIAQQEQSALPTETGDE
jgi:small-conductance mechanosensitive channel